MTTLVRARPPRTAAMFRPLKGYPTGPLGGWAIDWYSMAALCPTRQDPPEGLRVVGVAQCDDGFWWVVEP